MKRQSSIAVTFLLCLVLLWATTGHSSAQQTKAPKGQSSARVVSAHKRYAARGLVVSVSDRSVFISHESIPGLMDAMAMEFSVLDPKALKSLKPGMTVDFNVIVRGRLYAENIRTSVVQNFESEPMEAARLTILHNVINPAAAAREVNIGQPVPDFSLTDQTEKKIELSQLKGRVVALSFAYSRCRNPNYCFRLTNNLARLEKRFRDRTRRDLVLLTIVIDPAHDKGAVLSEYADVWKADPTVWHFLTGPLSEVRSIAGLFGMNFWNDEGLLTHPFHTVLIDRQGKLAANMEGNQFSAEQLGDLVQTIINQQ
jgi:protein SCO1